MGSLTREDVITRAGVDGTFLGELLRRGIVASDADGSFTDGVARAARVVRDLERAGLPLDGIAKAVEDGLLSFDLFEVDVYDRISPLTDETFRQAAERTNVPLDVLLVIREAIGFAVADPDDRMREDEAEVVPFVVSGIRAGFPPDTVERILRVDGESHRRMVETESEAWETHLLRPLIGSGMSPREAFVEASRASPALLADLDRAMVAIHRGQQDHVWMATTYDWVEDSLERAGVRDRVQRPPAMCFLDLAGYTRLTEERGDEAAAETARELTSLVQHNTHEHRGRVVKWLGDGVMLYFGEPAGALAGAVEMVDRVAAAGLPPAHVGVDAGPVIIQDGDYFGSTVNVAARIASYARAGEVLASEQAVDAAGDLPSGLRAEALGPVDLKGVTRNLILSRIARG